MNSYRSQCHVDGCQTRFIGVSREEYVEHLRDQHGESEAEIWDTLVVRPGGDPDA